MNTITKKISLFAFILFSHLLAFEQFPGYSLPQSGGSLNTLENVNDLSARFSSIMNLAVYILISIAFLYIVWNIVQYFIKGKSGDEDRKESGTNIMWCIAGLAIILSIWGLVNILMNTFGTKTNAPTDKFPKADFINAK
ncbi:MAG: pilin [Candidatus Taylorbacteria bacterium]|nr:pilin [Candidatus Taylorbacteria bacterium]